MKHISIIIALIVLTVGISTTRAQSNAALEKALMSAQSDFSSYFGSGNVSAISEMYAIDAEVVAPDGTLIRGREAIREFWRGYRDRGYRSFQVRNREVAGAGPGFAYSAGTCLSTKSDGALEQRRYMVIWKRDGSNWLIFRTIASVVVPG